MNQTPVEPALTVFVVEDDDGIRTSLARALAMRGYSVETHDSAGSFLAAFETAPSGDRPGVLILDYGMPEMNGLELQAHLNGRGATIPIIFITGHGGVPQSVQAIKGGAMDFLEKPFRQSALVERIEQGFQIVRERMAILENSRRHRARFDRLTAREMEIVERIIEAPSATASKEIAQHLGISPRTVDHHRARILEKLGIKSVAELIALAKS